MSTDSLRIEEIRQRVSRFKPGQWPVWEEDSEFVLNSVDDVRFLLAELDRTRGVLSDLLQDRPQLGSLAEDMRERAANAVVAALNRWSLDSSYDVTLDALVAECIRALPLVLTPPVPTTCTACGGDGLATGPPESRPCRRCNGTGSITPPAATAPQPRHGPAAAP
jgi:hypothetical protein